MRECEYSSNWIHHLHIYFPGLFIMQIVLGDTKAAPMLHLMSTKKEKLFKEKVHIHKNSGLVA